MGLALYGALGLLVGIMMAFVSMIIGLAGLSSSTAGASQSLLIRFGIGVGAIVVAPILYGVLGGTFAAIAALMYNLVARWLGGLEVDIS
jgi:hypothetical protein